MEPSANGASAKQPPVTRAARRPRAEPVTALDRPMRPPDREPEPEDEESEDDKKPF